MVGKLAIVMTSIATPNEVMRQLSSGAEQHGYMFIVAGDTKSPGNFFLKGCRFLSIKNQLETGFAYAAKCPTGHYCRKNVSYLVAIHDGAKCIIETDDDNFPRPEFFSQRKRHVNVPILIDAGWTNIYRYFTDATIWPRGLPLETLHREPIPLNDLAETTADCPIQQGLADKNPDVDAIYRLVLPIPQYFSKDRAMALGRGSWCPFNSQNTTWWLDAFPLMYLPANCSFRMTDIWRSFVAQRIAWENNWCVLFHEPTVWQERNEHNLMQDFKDEIPGYLNNRRIGDALEKLTLHPGIDAIPDNLRQCYGKLIEMELVEREELSLLEAWLSDLEQLQS